MSYGASPALQAAVYQALIGDAGLAALVGTAIYDAIPSGSLPATYVAIGPEAAYDKSDKSGGSAEHVFTVSVVTDSAGFQAAKDVAAGTRHADLPQLRSRKRNPRRHRRHAAH